MKALRAFISRLSAPLIRERQDQDLALELDAHVQMLTDDNIRAGISPEEARRRARIALGGVEAVKEDCRDARGVRWLEDFRQDIRYALRTLRQKPGFAAIAISTLGLGIGATTVMFTILYGVLFKPLPYPEPDRLVTLKGHTANNGDQFFSYPDFLDCLRESRSLSPMAGWVPRLGGTLSDPGPPRFVGVREVSSALFSVLGVHFFQGRAFLPEEDRPGGAPVVILSYGLWRSTFGGSPGAIGKALVFDGMRYTIVGIAPADFRLGGDDAGVFTPLGQDAAPYMQNRFAHLIGVVARLRRGATLAAAQAEIALIGNRLSTQYRDSNGERTFEVQPLRPDAGDTGPTLWLLLGAVGIMLLIACANVASLLLARAVSRGRELAMRVALGAGRSRLIRQCLTESTVLALCGGVLGFSIAGLGIHPFILFWPGSLPRAEEVRLDWHVLLFAVGVSLLSGLLFGLAPALRAPARDLEQTLRAGARNVTGASQRLHGGFVGTQIALAVVLLVSAGLLGRTILRVSALDPGFDIRNVLVTRMALSPGALAQPAQIRAVWRDVLDRARRVPGVQAVSMVDTVPMREGINELGYWTNAAVPAVNKLPLALATSVTPDYLKVMGIPLRAGRFFDDRDRIGNENVIVIDDTLAQHAFGGRNPVGQRLWVPDMSPSPVLVVGVVGHVRHWGLAGDDQAQVRAQFYYPFAQVPDPLLHRWSELMSIAVRTSVEPLNLLEPLRRELRGANGDQVLYEVHTMNELAGATLARQRFLLLLFGALAALALLLACIGIYGVLAYLTSRRVPEIGARMALGASAGDVVRLVLRESLRMIFAGIAVGILAALAAARLLERLVAGVRSAEPLTIAAMVSVLALAALAASFLPARRASRIDPMNALRQE